MAPESLIVPRFAAEPPQSPPPTGRWADRLRVEFLSACLRVDAEEDEDVGEAGSLTWFPERSWAGRAYVPVTSPTTTGFELYGYVSYAPGDDQSEPSDLDAWADFTDETADQHPEWELDIAEEVVGGWRGAGGEVAAMTLVWARPAESLRGAATVATAELGGVVVDQAELVDGRFTLLAPDAYQEHYLEVAVFDAAGAELARESLYADDDE